MTKQPGRPQGSSERMTSTNPSRRTKSDPLSDGEKPISQGRHEYRCSICVHPQRAAIEEEFVGWVSTATIAKDYSVCRNAIYRHAHALRLLEKRRRNVRAALERIIEKAGDVEVNAAAVVSAISAYARINNRGEWVERMETVNLNALFERMSAAELETYARDGRLPDWFEAAVTATGLDSRGSSNGQ